MINYLLILCMTLMGAVASVFFKKASGSESFAKMLLNINLYVGGFIYVVAAVLNIIVLRSMEYSKVMPLTSITYIWTMVISYILLKEKVTKEKIVGVICIVAGAILISIE